jgi:hypothetical protein
MIHVCSRPTSSVDCEAGRRHRQKYRLFSVSELTHRPEQAVSSSSPPVSACSALIFSATNSCLALAPSSSSAHSPIPISGAPANAASQLRLRDALHRPQLPLGQDPTGFLPAYQITKVLTAFHECVGSADVADPRTTYDPFAVGPIACFSYMAAIGVQVVFVNLTYTKPPENAKKWPAREAAPLERLQDSHPHQRDPRNERGQSTPGPAPGLRCHDDPERPRIPAATSTSKAWSGRSSYTRSCPTGLGLYDRPLQPSSE